MKASSSCAGRPKSNRLELHFSSCRRPWLVLARQRAGTGANSATKLETPFGQSATQPSIRAQLVDETVLEAAINEMNNRYLWYPSD